jgi:hypothetical protein
LDHFFKGIRFVPYLANLNYPAVIFLVDYFGHPAKKILYPSNSVVSDTDTLTLFTVFTAFVFVTLFFIFIIRYCLFQTEKIITMLRLDKGFSDENLEINVQRSGLLKVALIVIGGLMIADGLPLFVYNVFFYFQHSNSYTGFTDNHASPYVISNGLKLVFGYLMVTESQAIINFVERKRRKAVAKENADI